MEFCLCFIFLSWKNFPRICRWYFSEFYVCVFLKKEEGKKENKNELEIVLVSESKFGIDFFPFQTYAYQISRDSRAIILHFIVPQSFIFSF